MWQQLFLAFLGFSAGAIVAGGIVGLLIGLSIVPRYAGITRTASHIMLYEDFTLLGTVFGLFSGIFLGGWILALAEMADIFPILARRIRLTLGIPFLILCIAAGKALGSLLYYFRHWMP